MENWRQAALGANMRNKRIVLVSTYSKKAVKCVLVHTCPWKPFDVKHRLLQRVALQNKTNIISLFVVYGYYSDCSTEKFKDHLPLGPRQVLPPQASLVASQGRRTCLHHLKSQGWRSRLGSIEFSTLSM